MKTLYKLHAWTGLISGLFLAFICVTGSIAVFRPELERAVDWGGYDFDIVVEGEPITLEHAIDVALAKYPDARLLAADHPALPQAWSSHGPAYKVELRDGRTTRHVLVDPYRAAVVAEQVRAQGAWGDTLRQMHVRFLYGKWQGRVVVGVFGVVLVVSTVLGLLIFTRFNRHSWKPTVRTGRGARITWADLHKVVGLGSVAFNIMFGVTGAVIGLENLNRYTKIKPAVQETTAADPQPVAQLAPGLLATLEARAVEVLPGSVVTGFDFAHERRGHVTARLEHHEAHLIKGNVSFVRFDAGTGEPIAYYDAREATVLGRLYFSMEPLHFGRFGGLMWVKLLWAIMGLTGGFLAISGYVIYALRLAKRWRKSPAAAVASGAAVAVAEA